MDVVFDGVLIKNFKGIKELYVNFSDKTTIFGKNAKVFPARLYGTKEKTDAKIEVFLLRELNEEQRLWDVLVEPARKIRIGNKLFFEDDGPMVAEVIDNTTSRGRTLRFLYDCPHDEFKAELFGLGEAPLPRYIISKSSLRLKRRNSLSVICYLRICATRHNNKKGAAVILPPAPGLSSAARR